MNMSTNLLNKESLEEFKERVRKQYCPMYYDRQGNEMSLMDWGAKCEDQEYRIIRQEYVGDYFISTVWIGLNMNIFRGTPLIFETMIFIDNDDLKGYQERYCTEEEAIAGHELAVKICKTKLENI